MRGPSTIPYVLLSAIGLLAACGPTRLHDGTVEDPAVVHAHRAPAVAGIPEDVTFEVRLVGFDGRAVDDPRPVVEVAPGRHRFALSWVRREFVWRPAWNFTKQETSLARKTGEGVATVSLNARAGERYRVRVRGGRTGDPTIRLVPER